LLPFVQADKQDPANFHTKLNRAYRNEQNMGLSVCLSVSSNYLTAKLPIYTKFISVSCHQQHQRSITNN